MKKVTGLVLAAIFSIALSFAQTEKAQLNGTVTDSSGGSVAGASVAVVNVRTGQPDRFHRYGRPIRGAAARSRLL